jgi:hypothetical protein
MTAKIGKLERVPIRELWKHEERGFSRWLFEHPELLRETLGFGLEFTEREKWIGAFKVDLVGETDSGELLIVENQLGPSDHDHLGKLLTYAMNLGAKAAVWIVTEGRPEHVLAISALNESTPADMAFYLLRVDTYRIGDSPAAPLLTLIVGPSENSKAIGKEKKEHAERHVLRLKFWEQLLKRAAAQGLLLHANRAPVKELWLGAGAGRGGFTWTYLVYMDGTTAVELYIDTGDGDRNKSYFDQLYGKRNKIESDFRGALEWERLDEKRASRIRSWQTVGGLRDPEDKWPAIHDAMIDAMRRLSAAIKPHMDTL